MGNAIICLLQFYNEDLEKKNKKTHSILKVLFPIKIILSNLYQNIFINLFLSILPHTYFTIIKQKKYIVQ